MKRYTIGLTLLFALVNTGCEDAKAESIDNSDEITQLQKEITELKSRVDTLFASRPKVFFFEGQIASDGTFKVEHPSIKPNNLPLIHYQFEFDDGAIAIAEICRFLQLLHLPLNYKEVHSHFH